MYDIIIDDRQPMLISIQIQTVKPPPNFETHYLCRRNATCRINRRDVIERFKPLWPLFFSFTKFCDTSLIVTWEAYSRPLGLSIFFSDFTISFIII